MFIYCYHCLKKSNLIVCVLYDGMYEMHRNVLTLILNQYLDKERHFRFVTFFLKGIYKLFFFFFFQSNKKRNKKRTNNFTHACSLALPFRYIAVRTRICF